MQLTQKMAGLGSAPKETLRMRIAGNWIIIEHIIQSFIPRETLEKYLVEGNKPAGFVTANIKKQ